MQPDDFDNFARVLDAAYSMHSKSLTADARSLFFASLGEYSLADVRRAFSAHLRDPQRGQFPPKPADLIAQLRGAPEQDGRPGAEEAWAISLASLDESATVVWTQDMAEAFEISKACGDDEVAMRMAFKDAYTRIVGQRRAAGISPVWLTSLGFDASKRQAVIADAVRLNRIPLASVQHLLPAPDALAIGYDAPSESQSEEGLARLKSIMATMPSQEEKLERANAARIARERQQLAQAKSAAAQRVDEYQRVHA